MFSVLRVGAEVVVGRVRGMGELNGRRRRCWRQDDKGLQGCESWGTQVSVVVGALSGGGDR